MSKIEDRLWADLIGEPEAEGALCARMSPATKRRASRAPFAAGGLAVAGATVAVVLALTAGGNTTPAYAVSVNPDGTVSLTVDEIIGVQGANEALTKLGVRARVAEIEPGCSQTGEIDRDQENEPLVEPHKIAGDAGTIESQLQRRGGAFAGISMIIHADQIPEGDTVVISAELDKPINYQGKAISAAGFSFGLYRGAGPTCHRPLTGD
jgi:hypothetical protein